MLLNKNRDRRGNVIDEEDDRPSFHPQKNRYKGLDCRTEKGKTYIHQQLECAERLEGAWKCQVIATPIDLPSDVDALLVRDGILMGIAEIKARELDLNKLSEFGSYLITNDKITRIAELSRRLRVAGFIIVSLLHDRNIVFWKISDEAGNLLVNAEVKNTITQATCNGGSAERENAYLPLSSMKFVTKVM
jgi:hypothetical protein